MLHPRLVFASSVLAACSGGDKATDPPDEDTESPTEDSGTTSTTTVPPGQVGSIVVDEYLPSTGIEDSFVRATAMFANDDGGVLNMSACLLLDGGCIVALDPYTVEAETAVRATRFWEVGPQVTIGGAALGLDPDDVDPIYVLEDTEAPTGEISWEGDDLEAFTGGNVTLPDLEVTAPDPSADVLLGPGDDVVLRWTGGDAVLALGGPNPTVLNVSGNTHTFSAADLGFDTPLASGYVYVSRYVTGEFDAGGHTIRTFGARRQLLWLRYADLDGYTEIDAGSVGEACADAIPLAPLVGGAYTIDLATHSDDQDLGPENPYTGYSTPGRDVYLPVLLGPGQSLTATYQQRDYDASVYVLDGACGTSVAGADDTLTAEPEELTFASTPGELVILALDAYDPDVGSPAILDLVIE